MTAIRIVCTYDAVETAEKLARLLGAEGEDVHVSHGRPSLDQLPAARTAKEAVLLIWSHQAPTTHYMLEWADAIPPERLVEVARAPGWPRAKHRAPVIDLCAWRGERSRAWHLLTHRLRMVINTIDPPAQPLRGPAIGVGVVGAIAASVALMVGPDDATVTKEASLEPEKISQLLIDHDGMGGALVALEPASIGDDVALWRAPARLSAEPLPDVRNVALAPVPDFSTPDLHNATLLERLSALNPLRDDENK